MKLLDIIRNNVAFCERSGISVEVDERFSTVAITDRDGGEVFLQGDEADEFVRQARELWAKAKVIGMDEAYLFYAYDYADVLN